MRTAAAVLIFALACVPASARIMWFDPPNPTDQTPVTAHIADVFTNCSISSAVAARNGATIEIAGRYATCPANPTVDVTVNLGTLPAGVYDVNLGAGNLLIGLGEAKLVVREANPPFTVTPSAAFSGDRVTLTGAPVVACTPACTAAPIWFGGQRATVVSVSPTGVTVQVPARAGDQLPNPVDVQAASTTSVAAFEYLDSNTDPAFVEHVLFPVLVNGPGARGSQWRTDAALHNANPFPFSENTALFDTLCFPICDARPQANDTVVKTGVNAPDGLVIVTAREEDAKANFSLLVRDISREATDFGTSIPVVREKDFYAHPFTIVNVPSDARFRVALRAYSIYGPANPLVQVATAANPSQPLAQFALPLQMIGQSHAFGYVGDLLTAYPQLAGQGPLLISFSGFSPATPVWGFASITNNETQHVTTVAPLRGVLPAGSAPVVRPLERVLWPVMIAGPGAFGAQWQTDAAWFDGTSGTVTITQRGDAPAGVVDLVPPEKMDVSNASLVIRDRSRDASDYGTSVPVVREHDFYDRPFAIVNVPSDSRYRVALRLYAYDGAPSLDLTVATIDGNTRSQRTVQLQTVAAGTHSFAYVANVLPPELAGKGPLVVRVSGPSTASRAWGFVSITNNDTQHVTVVQPE